jgi:hypothetical protein
LVFTGLFNLLGLQAFAASFVVHSHLSLCKLRVLRELSLIVLGSLSQFGLINLRTDLRNL